MAKINVLDKHTAELIAAGEVVERPSSVIKELVENCMDAGATVISVDIKNGGVTYMSVTDNGEGMEREDVPLAFLRHATSKVRTAPDLDAIATLGFRGEALASVAAVSRVELITRREEDLAGTHYVIEGGEPQELEDIGCAKGTTIVVRDLFYNVPARMKFLKKDVSEGNAVAAVMDRLALSHPNISFSLTRDGREELHTPGDGDLHNCIYAVLGKEFAKNLIPVDYTLDGVKVHGFVSALSAARPNRTMQHFFVNRRYVKTRTAMAALEQAYKGSIMSGKFPACVLFVELPPETVDANVHPAKVEIRFIDERPVFSAVYHGVKTAIESGHRPKTVEAPAAKPVQKGVQLSFEEHRAITPPAAATSAVPSPTAPPARVLVPDIQKTASSKPMSSFTPAWRMNDPSKDGAESAAPVLASMLRAAQEEAKRPPDSIASILDEGKTPPDEPSVEDVTVAVVEETAVRPSVRYIGELFATYILCEMDGAFYIIDKHAAHERLIYNQLTSTEHTESQTLLVPISVTLSSEEYDALMNHEADLTAAGFEVEEFGDREILLRAIPAVLTGCNLPDTVREIASGFASGAMHIRSSAIDWLYHSTACRAAVKAGDITSAMELERFAQRVLYNDDLRTCPHGRPVCVAFTKQEIEKFFGRIV